MPVRTFLLLAKLKDDVQIINLLDFYSTDFPVGRQVVDGDFRIVHLLRETVQMEPHYLIDTLHRVFSDAGDYLAVYHHPLAVKQDLFIENP